MDVNNYQIPENYKISEPISQEDGSDIYEIEDANAEENQENSIENEKEFEENLAEDLSDDVLRKISAFLNEKIQEDISSRENWLESVNRVKDYLGFSIEDTKNIPFPNATRTFDTTLSTSLVRFYATMRSEFFPDSGPAHIKLSEAGYWQNEEGMLGYEQLEKLEEEAKQYLNDYLTIEDKDYYADCTRSLLYLGFYGTVIKKIFIEPTSGKVLSRFIIPEDFIVNNDCISLLESDRLTHVLKMSERDILALEKSGYYKKYDISTSSDPSISSNNSTKNEKDIGINTSGYNNKSLKVLYESHVYLSLDSFTDGINFSQSADEKDLSLPYIVTFNPETGKILRITRNWEENDPKFQRINYFVSYQYLPGFGIYGLGLAHLLGTNSITLTKLLRQLIDAGSFKNLPGGLRQKGVKQQDSNITIGPGQFIEVDTGNRPIQDVFMPLPYSEPSAVLRELRQELIAQTRELAATAELKMNDQNPNTPVGTTLAMIEINQKIQAATFKNFYFSLSEELTKIFNLLKISKGVFQSIPQADVIPTADPALDSKMHKLIKAESLLKVASQFPDLYNKEEINRRYCQALGIDQIDKILIPPAQPEEVPGLDPVTENMRAIKGEPVQAYIWQDHASHIAVHTPMAEENQALQAHIAEHNAFAYLVSMQQQMGIEIPPMEEIEKDQELQNHIALMAAQAVQQQQQQQQEQEQAMVDQKTQALLNIAQMEDQRKREEISIKAQLEKEKLSIEYQQKMEDIASRERLKMAEIASREGQKMADISSKEKIEENKIETSVFKSQLDLESKMAKIEADKEVNQQEEIEL